MLIPGVTSWNHFFSSVKLFVAPDGKSRALTSYLFFYFGHSVVRPSSCLPKVILSKRGDNDAVFYLLTPGNEVGVNESVWKGKKSLRLDQRYG